MKLKTLLTIFLLITSILLAQRPQDIRTGSRIPNSYDLSDKTIQGSPYLLNNFMPAKISVDNDTIYDLRYNAHIDEMEIQSANKKISAINKNINNLSVVFIKSKKTYKSINYINDKGIAQRGFFVHLNDSNSKIFLLKKEMKKFVKREKTNNGYKKARPAHFKRLDDIFYVVIKNNTAQILPKKKKDILKLFPENSGVISDYIKSNKIKVSKEEDLLKLINFINTL